MNLFHDFFTLIEHLLYAVISEYNRDVSLHHFQQNNGNWGVLRLCTSVYLGSPFFRDNWQ